MTNIWLAKSEEEVYSIEHLKRDKRTLWEGVRNYQARNMLRDDWQVGDKILFYHSNSAPTGIAGLAKVSKVGIPDPTQFMPKSDYFDPKSKKENPTWVAPEIAFVQKFQLVITLDMIRKEKKLKSMAVLKRGNRLSIQPVTNEEFQTILKMTK